MLQSVKLTSEAVQCETCSLYMKALPLSQTDYVSHEYSIRCVTSKPKELVEPALADFRHYTQSHMPVLVLCSGIVAIIDWHNYINLPTETLAAGIPITGSPQTLSVYNLIPKH